MYSFQIPLLPIKLFDISIGVLEGLVDFALFFPLETTRKAGGLQILRCQGIAVGYSGRSHLELASTLHKRVHPSGLDGLQHNCLKLKQQLLIK
jgi:hypothetical protein